MFWLSRNINDFQWMNKIVRLKKEFETQFDGNFNAPYFAALWMGNSPLNFIFITSGFLLTISLTASSLPKILIFDFILVEMMS